MSQTKLMHIFKILGSVTEVVSAPKEPNYFYVLQQGGKILKFNRADQEFDSVPFLDLTPEVERVYKEKPMKVKFPDERGLLSLAFHPEYNTVGSLFYGVFIVIHSEIANPKLYSEEFRQQVPNPDNMTCITQYRYNKGNTPEMTKKSRMNVLCFPEPQANHNGGGLLFGKNGYLWIGVGDGGGANDEHGPLINSSLKDSFLGNAQNILSIHGKILRIEVVQPMPQGVPYAIPQDNPFAGHPERGRQEIVAWGFRNPWRMSMDSDGNLLVGDVGQNRFEMVKVVNQLGGNYGWRAMEGYEVFNQQVLDWIQKSGQTVIPPIIVYPREMGIAIVGVEKYEGKLLPNLKGKLIIADHSGRIIIATKNGDKWSLESLNTLIKKKFQLRSLNRDQDNELFFSAFDPKTGQAIIYQLGYDKEQPIKISTQPKNSSMNIIQSQKLSSQPSIGASGLTNQDIDRIIKQGVAKALNVKSAFRKNKLGDSTHVRMHFSIIRRGDKKASLVYSMPDAWDGSVDISKGKANTAVSFSSDQNALTSRTIGVASQPGAPLWQIGNSNKVGGIIEFPGGVPLYKNNILVGAVGVSGDGVDQDEAVASAAAKGYSPKDFIRSDKVVNLPYLNEKSVDLLSIRTAPPRKGELIINYQGQTSSGSKSIKIVGSKEWAEYMINNPTVSNVAIHLFDSGDRNINDLSSLVPYTKNFVTINFFHSTISNLVGLEKFTRLKSLNLSRTEIDNAQLSSLSNLKQLERLELNGNDIDDLSAISGLNPVHLGLACLQITSIQALNKMTNLVILDLYQNPNLVDILALGSLTSLRDLDIRKTQISPLIKRDLPNLIRFVHD